MHAHLAEVMAEAGFHRGANGWVEWLAGRAQHFVDNGGNFGGIQIAACLAFEGAVLLRAFFTLTAHRLIPAGAFALEQAMWSTVEE
jgi:hypothetical protein